MSVGQLKEKSNSLRENEPVPLRITVECSTEMQGTRGRDRPCIATIKFIALKLRIHRKTAVIRVIRNFSSKNCFSNLGSRALLLVVKF